MFLGPEMFHMTVSNSVEYIPPWEASSPRLAKAILSYIDTEVPSLELSPCIITRLVTSRHVSPSVFCRPVHAVAMFSALQNALPSLSATVPSFRIYSYSSKSPDK
jgi:hypothetical protein